jgi:hypothetical protein
MSSNKYLSIDPSGSGTTGCVFYDEKNQKYEFFSFTGKIWQEHFNFLFQTCQNKKVNFLLYETTNFINKRTKSTADLFRLLGAIEILPLFQKNVKKCAFILVKQVKDLYKKVNQGILVIPQLERKIGRKGGWFFQGQKINVHELDALLGLYLYLSQF